MMQDPPCAPAFGLLRGGALDVLEASEIQGGSSGGTGSLVFSGLEVRLGLRDERMSTACVAAAEIPIRVDCARGLVGYRIRLRGAIAEKTAGARVALFVDVAGTARVFEYAVGTRCEAALRETMFALDERPARNQNFVIAAIPPLAINVMLIAQRRHVSDLALASLDSIEIEAVLESRSG